MESVTLEAAFYGKLNAMKFVAVIRKSLEALANVEGQPFIF